MALWKQKPITPVATVEIAFLEGQQAAVSRWVADGTRQRSNYHAILHFLMHYGRVLFFLSFRDTAYELVGWMDDAVKRLAEAEDGAPVDVARGWTIAEACAACADVPGETGTAPRAIWGSTLNLVGPGSYRCKSEMPKEPEDADGQAVALLHLQSLVNDLPALERGYIALAITGMHEYYERVQIWANSKSLHPAPEHGIDYARRVLEGPEARKARWSRG